MICRGVVAILLGLVATDFTSQPITAQDEKTDPRVDDIGAKVLGKAPIKFDVTYNLTVTDKK
jgi:hypothetical protein